jgi:hypothetical protein
MASTLPLHTHILEKKQIIDALVAQLESEKNQKMRNLLYELTSSISNLDSSKMNKSLDLIIETFNQPAQFIQPVKVVRSKLLLSNKRLDVKKSVANTSCRDVANPQDTQNLADMDPWRPPMCPILDSEQTVLSLKILTTLATIKSTGKKHNIPPYYKTYEVAIPTDSERWSDITDNDDTDSWYQPMHPILESEHTVLSLKIQTALAILKSTGEKHNIPPYYKTYKVANPMDTERWADMKD